jgi:plastocyanin
VVPKVEILGNGKKGKISINSGESVLISWATEGVGSCSASGNWSGIKNVSGSQKTDNLNFSRVYNISCKDASGKVVSASLSVDVAQLKVDIKADNSDGPVTIDPGKAVKLSWTSSGATQCSASGNWSGDKVISGSEYSGYFSYPRDYVYTIYCTGPSGGVQDSVTVNILTPKVDIKVNNSDGPITIDSGKTVRLSWTAVGVSSCTASGDWSGSKKNSGSETTAKIFSSKSYSITCRDVSRESFGDTAVVNIK